jgi:hypothetical protein
MWKMEELGDIIHGATDRWKKSGEGQEGMRKVM